MVPWVGSIRDVLATGSDAAVLVPALVDLGIKDVLKDFNRAMFNAVFGLIELLFSEVLGEMLKLDPGELSKFQDMYELSTVLFFSFLTLYGLSYLGMFQLFPEHEKTDPYRFMSRAFAALMVLLIVNPPGNGTLFSQGLFAWAFEISNASIDLFLEGANFSQSLPSDPNLGDDPSLKTTVMLLLYGGIILLVVGVTQILLFMVLVARQFIVYLTYGLFPLLIIFWVADAGPLKYPKQLAEKLFKATGMLIPAGILFAAIFAVGTTFVAESISTSPAMQPASATTADGAFATPTGFVIELSQPVAGVFATCLLPTVLSLQTLSGTGLGGAASAASGKLKQAGSKKLSGAASALPGMGGGDSSTGTTTSSTNVQDVAPSTAPTGNSELTDNTAPTPDNPATGKIVADGGGDYTRPGAGQHYLDPDREYTKDHAIAEANHEMDDDDFWASPDEGLSHTFDDATPEEIQQRDQRAKELYLQKGSDVTLDDIDTAEDWKQLNHDQKQEIQYRQLQALQDTGNDYISAAASDTLKTGMKMAGGVVGFAVGGAPGAAVGALAFSAIQGAAGQGASTFARKHQEHGSIRKATTETLSDFGDQMRTTRKKYSPGDNTDDAASDAGGTADESGFK